MHVSPIHPNKGMIMGAPEVQKKSMTEINLNIARELLDEGRVTDARHSQVEAALVAALAGINRSGTGAVYTPARMAEYLSLEARLDAIRYPHPTAPELFEHADSVWREVIAPTGLQLQRMWENKFFWFREGVSQGTPNFDLYDELLESPWISRSLRRRAQLLKNFGEKWVPIDIRIGRRF